MKEFICSHYSTIISTIALLLSVGQIFVSAIKKRTNIKVSLEDVQQYSYPKRKNIIVLFSFINKSNAPINIVRASLVGKNGKEIECRLRKSYIGEHYYPKNPETDIPRTERVFTLSLPISLMAHGAERGHIEFDIPCDYPNYNEGETMRFKFYTDKRTIPFSSECKTHRDEQMKYL